MNGTIIVIGFMGCGKSTVGRLLAKELAVPFLDTDEAIERKEGMKISVLFQMKGEEYFRNAETSLLQELLSAKREQVLSTGGGMPLRPENAGLLRQLGAVIYLKSSADTIYGRLRDNTDRPLLAGENPRRRIEELMELREPIYSAASDDCVATDGKAPAAIVQEILLKVRGLRES